MCDLAFSGRLLLSFRSVVEHNISDFIEDSRWLHFGEFAAASLAQAVKHEPCAFLLYADLFGDLHGRDSLASGDKQVHGIQPLVQRDVTALEDRASTDREVKLALIAAVEASLAWSDAVLTGTGWASDALRPETALKVGSRRLFVGKHLEQFEGADSRTAHCGPRFSASNISLISM